MLGARADVRVETYRRLTLLHLLLLRSVHHVLLLLPMEIVICCRWLPTVGRSYRSGTALVGSGYCGMHYGRHGPTASRHGGYCYQAGSSRHLVVVGTVVAAGNTSEGCTCLVRVQSVGRWH